MNDELVDELARRLAKMSEDLPYLDDFEIESCPSWEALAREVIRQMEWARREHPNCEQHGPIHLCGPLTLAPPEWKP